MKKPVSKGQLVYIDPDHGFGIVRTENGNYIIDQNQLRRAGIRAGVGVLEISIQYTLKLDSPPVSNAASLDSTPKPKKKTRVTRIARKSLRAMA